MLLDPVTRCYWGVILGVTIITYPDMLLSHSSSAAAIRSPSAIITVTLLPTSHPDSLPTLDWQLFFCRHAIYQLNVVFFQNMNYCEKMHTSNFTIWFATRKSTVVGNDTMSHELMLLPCKSQRETNISHDNFWCCGYKMFLDHVLSVIVMIGASSIWRKSVWPCVTEGSARMR